MYYVSILLWFSQQHFCFCFSFYKSKIVFDTFSFFVFINRGCILFPVVTKAVYNAVSVLTDLPLGTAEGGWRKLFYPFYLDHPNASKRTLWVRFECHFKINFHNPFCRLMFINRFSLNSFCNFILPFTIPK